MRHRGMLAPINSVKHYVQFANSTVSSGSALTVTIVDAVAKNTDRTTTAQVEEGSKITAVYIECWLNGIGATDTTQQNIVIMKLPGGSTAMSYSNMLNMPAYENKKNILFASQGNIGAAGNQSIPVFRGWLKIPKGKQRFGLGDSLLLIGAATGQSILLCMFATFKEYY